MIQASHVFLLARRALTSIILRDDSRRANVSPSLLFHSKYSDHMRRTACLSLLHCFPFVRSVSYSKCMRLHRLISQQFHFQTLTASLSTQLNADRKTGNTTRLRLISLFSARKVDLVFFVNVAWGRGVSVITRPEFTEDSSLLNFVSVFPT
jgi:hypothetical protein